MENTKSFYSNGKLLLTGEYAVLDGALSLAVPTSRGQSLSVRENGALSLGESESSLSRKSRASQLRWTSRDERGKVWFEGSFEVAGVDGNGQFSFKPMNSRPASKETIRIAETLSNLLREAQHLNPYFLSDSKTYEVETQLDFPRDWGLGSSSTLINNIAQWAEVDAYQLLWRAFSGSGYDIACARHHRPILFRSGKVVKEVDFAPPFQDRLYFVYLNKKQNSRDGIANYRKRDVKEHFDKPVLVESISIITRKLVSCSNLEEFGSLVNDHEKLISETIGMPTVKQSRFPDFPGTLKSLGAWGGDFILATGGEEVPDYFKERGFSTVLRYSEMVLAAKGK